METTASPDEADKTSLSLRKRQEGVSRQFQCVVSQIKLPHCYFELLLLIWLNLSGLMNFTASAQLILQDLSAQLEWY